MTIHIERWKSVLISIKEGGGLASRMEDRMMEKGAHLRRLSGGPSCDNDC